MSVEKLSKTKHGKERKRFDCTNESLNKYLKETANQDQKDRLAVVYVSYDEQANEIKGYYTLSNDGISASDVPEHFKAKYKNLNVTLIGRLAVNSKYQGKGVGGALLAHAIKTCIMASNVIASSAIIVDPIDKKAVSFYKHYGFIVLDSGRMFLAMKTAIDAFG
ncbi:GNAT family N-acetyltransferase [Flammeovirga yaeyamensis]|uniref:GNAT family N-acetyltransferase n=1 Tax=Flammeovirga yaeyamensis TaxID=367791 RepID=A0AAX1N674_9BACT|nr:GNAT family N-acetyltransferase [Flammeovirga yaeyamensis]MBB3697521.1 GNAT superfamily N-acetyltransferase [Flammeovirga yaeyamensis]NMF36215.1 GNAT family N-acetyltransferase [Flammeovirga yaeyamensis]QWG02944.1 GNAT family N-acetyltransferase [Flammeovirga yaeyamensis]